MSIQWQSQFLLSSTRNDRKCTFYYLQYQLDVIRVYAAVTLIEYFVTAMETRSWCAIILLHCIQVYNNGIYVLNMKKVRKGKGGGRVADHHESTKLLFNNWPLINKQQQCQGRTAMLAAQPATTNNRVHCVHHMIYMFVYVARVWRGARSTMCCLQQCTFTSVDRWIDRYTYIYTCVCAIQI